MLIRAGFPGKYSLNAHKKYVCCLGGVTRLVVVITNLPKSLCPNSGAIDADL